MKKVFTLILLLPLLVFCGTNKELPPDPENNDPENVEPEVEPLEPEAVITLLSKEALEIGYEGGSSVMRFTANYDWKVTTENKWIHMNPESGKASENTVVSRIECDDNPTSVARKGSVVITAGNAQKVVSISQPADPDAKPAQPLVSGSTVLATNPNVEKFLTEVSYPDQDWSFTSVLDYYGGFNGKTYNEDGVEDPAGKAFDWDNQPNSDKPMSYSINWTEANLDGDSDMTLVLSDQYGWKSETEVPAGALYTNITNLVPNDQYTYKVTSTKGKVITEGNFSTTGHLHHLFFRNNCRNIRDLGGWKTLDGKTVKYRRLYRGGRMQNRETVNASGRKEILAEGIGAQLDLRNTDKLNQPADPSMDFLAPGIEEGGKWMLTHGNSDGNFGKQCFEFVVKSLRANKSVYFHCSLGRDRTGTMDILLLGLLGVREGDISKAYEVTYFAPVGYSVSSSEKRNNPEPIFKNTRKEWVYSDVAPYFWGLSPDGTFAGGVEYYLLNVAGVSQTDIDDFKRMMLE